MGENLGIKTYIIPSELQDFWPQNKLAYTIDHYQNRTWYDSIFSITFALNINRDNYVDIMKVKFNCAEHDGKLFYSTKQQCEEAINSIESIVIMDRLTK